MKYFKNVIIAFVVIVLFVAAIAGLSKKHGDKPQETTTDIVQSGESIEDSPGTEEIPSSVLHDAWFSQLPQSFANAIVIEGNSLEEGMSKANISAKGTQYALWNESNLSGAAAHGVVAYNPYPDVEGSLYHYYIAPGDVNKKLPEGAEPITSANAYMRWTFEVPEDGVYRFAFYNRVKTADSRFGYFQIDDLPGVEVKYILCQDHRAEVIDETEGAYIVVNKLDTSLKAGQHTITYSLPNGGNSWHIRNIYVVKVGEYVEESVEEDVILFKINGRDKEVKKGMTFEDAYGMGIFGEFDFVIESGNINGGNIVYFFQDGTIPWGDCSSVEADTLIREGEEYFITDNMSVSEINFIDIDNTVGAGDLTVEAWLNTMFAEGLPLIIDEDGFLYNTETGHYYSVEDGSERVKGYDSINYSECYTVALQ